MFLSWFIELRVYLLEKECLLTPAENALVVSIHSIHHFPDRHVVVEETHSNMGVERGDFDLVAAGARPFSGPRATTSSICLDTCP